MTPTLLPVRLAAIAFAVVLAVGCTAETLTTGHSSPPSIVTTVPPPISTTSAASTTSAPSTTGAVPDDRVQGLLDSWASEGRGGVAVALAGHDEELTVAAAGSAGPDGGIVEPDSAVPGREPVEDLRRRDAAATRRRRDDRPR